MFRSFSCLLVVALVAIPSNAADARAASVLVEAETLKAWKNKSGGGFWVHDPQFVDQVGSAYLMAHGIGVPVKDVTGKFTAPQNGQYRVLVRTLDWHAPHGIGKFQVLIDGKPLEATFGTEGKGKWIWQNGGKVTLSKGEHTLALHDLDGLQGRCDCILLTTDEKLAPPDGGAREQQPWRRKIQGRPKPEDAGTFDLVIVGGGAAGMSAAWSAARFGLKVALIDNMPGLGGKTGRSPRWDWSGGKKVGVRYPQMGVAVIFAYRWFKDKREKLAVSIFHNTHVYGVEMKDGLIRSAIAVHTRTGREKKFSAPLFVDATGDGNLGFLAGAEYMYGQESRDVFGEPAAPKKDAFEVKHKEVHGSNLSFGTKSKKGAPLRPAPDFSDMDPYSGCWTDRQATWVLRGGWDNESGYFLKRPEQDERVRDLAFLRYYAAQSWLAKHSKRQKNVRIAGMSWFLQKRESRRLVGDVVLREQDFWCVEGTGRRVGQGWYANAKPHREARQFEDGVVTTTWHMDVHTSRRAGGRGRLPKELWHHFGGQLRDKKKAKPPIGQCHVPYRTMYSKNVNNMFMIGRCVSASRLAFGALRITNTTSMMGIAVGRSAAVCRKHKCLPREAYKEHLGELKKAWALPSKASSLAANRPGR